MVRSASEFIIGPRFAQTRWRVSNRAAHRVSSFKTAKTPLLRACEEYRPHPCATASPLSLEELAKQASRRMDTTHGLAAILRDAAKRPLLRMRKRYDASFQRLL
jgi:hypothetical protein